MPEHTRESITTEFADVCIRVSATEAARVKLAFSQFLDLAGVEYRIPKNDNDDLVTWEEAFPELGTGSVLQGARDREGLTQAELAEKIGAKPHHISEMENGKRAIGKSMAKRLAQVLNTGYKVFL
ncbi:MAG: helix-turn-helix transcriptional regulator [Deltaproteobacteria bacterium]|nr:helix-turn-helix transcriptional regulator [Deltaproteobacteria bacterium]